MREALRPRRLSLKREKRIFMLSESFIQDLDRNIGVPVSRFFLYEVDRLEHPAHTAGAELVLERESPLENGARTDGPRCSGDRLRRRHGPRTRRQGRIVIAETDIAAQIDHIKTLFVGQIDEAFDIRKWIHSLAEHGSVESNLHCFAFRDL